MDEHESVLRGWGLYVLLIPLFLISLALSLFIGCFDFFWLHHGHARLSLLPKDLQFTYALGQTMKWTPVGAVAYWLISAMPWGLARWLHRGDVLGGVALAVSFQLFGFIVYSVGAVAASLWR
jgi:hypothetical protein